jgi:hypothetical protein
MNLLDFLAEAVAKPIFCHPERSEESQVLENARFFA